MNAVIQPISVSTAFSLIVHILLAVAVLQTPQVMQATGVGLEIELVSSTYVSNQDETEQAANRAESSNSEQHDTKPPDDNIVQTASHDQSGETADITKPVSTVTSRFESVDDNTGEQASTRSTNSAQHKNAIIELLHSKISEHKQYPYLARRQRREGVATVEFVLHPDGTVLNPRLVHSSRTSSLDKAALDAVKNIEPFTPAKNFIDQPEAYRVDVVFNVL